MNKKGLISLSTCILLLGVISCTQQNNLSSENIESISSDLFSSSGALSSKSEEQSVASSEKLSSSFDSEGRKSEIVSSEIIEDASYVAEVTFPTLIDSSKELSVSFELKESMIPNNSSVFSKDLALFAVGNCIANQSKEMITKFYNDLTFDNVQLSKTYESGHNESSIGYVFAHKKLKNTNLITVTLQGYDYGLEWADNFNIGIEGEHAGFAARADEVNMNLKVYCLSNNYSKDNSMFLISGYSRGGAVANLLGKRIDDEEFLATKENVYVYTLESPKGGLPTADPDKYNNIFNIFNSADLITYMPPTEYGFIRYGKDIDIYNENLDEMLSSYNEILTLAPFNEQLTGIVEKETDLPQYIINSMISYSQPDQDSPKQIQNREEFVNNYQASIGYALGLFMSLKTSTTDKMMADISEKSMWELLGLLSEDGLYDFLKPYLDEDGIQYDDEELKGHISVAIDFVSGPGSSILILATAEGAFQRMIQMHYAETDYVLLKNYSISE